MPTDTHPEPMLGALLRRPWQAIRRRIHRDLVDAGFVDVRPRDLAVLQWPGPEGLRLTDLATAAQMSKQATKPLVDHLEHCGYLVRAPDPTDGRAQIMRLTPRGRRLLAATRAAVEAIEADFAERLGPTRLAELRALLIDVAAVATGNEPADGRPAPDH